MRSWVFCSITAALSVEQQVTHGLGAFMRLSANDGASESWAFTEIDRSLALGVVEALTAAVAGTGWREPALALLLLASLLARGGALAREFGRRS